MEGNGGRNGSSWIEVTADGRTQRLEGRAEWVMGRGREADVKVPGEQVGRRHAAVRYAHDGWTLHDLKSLNGVWVEGRRTETVALPPGMTTAIRLGGPDGPEVRLSPGPDGRPPAPPVPMPDFVSGRPSGPTPAGAPMMPPPATPAPGQAQPFAAAPVPHGAMPGGMAAPPQMPPGQLPPGQLPPAGRPGGQVPGPPSRPTSLGMPATAGPTPTMVSQGPRLSAVHPVRGGASITIGRHTSNMIVVDDLLVSRHHARFDPGAPGQPGTVTDLNSANGTYVNGARVSTAPVRPGDVITVGPQLLWYDGTQLLEYDEAEGVSFAAANLSVVLPGGKQLLHDVSFSLRPRTLMAVVGPSGAGKSTLLHALAGLKPATSGTVVYAGRDLYAEYDDLSARIGFVPQQDILHQVLTVKQALSYGARLRFPAETTRKERAQRIEQVAAELSLSGQLSTRVSRLSGGERKRASTAMELLTKPSLLFLDEPTSGLDTDLDREVMHRLRGLADDGRTVVVVTHNLDYLEVCDLVLVLARGGHAAYLGPPKGAFAYFGATSWADIFSTLKTREPAAWGASFAGWRDRDPRSYPPQLGQVGRGPSHLPVIRRQSVVSQLGTLVRRHIATIFADPTLLIILALLPGLLAGISRVVPAEHGLSLQPPSLDARQLLLVLIVGGCLAGAGGAVRELVKERAIYQRERSVGLSRGAYLASKILVTTWIGAVQGLALTYLALLGRPGPDEALVLPDATFEVALAVAATTATSALVGLALSAAVSDENQAMPLLVVASMAQLVMCGGLVPVVGRAVLEQVSWLLPARWGYAAAASTTNITVVRSTSQDSLWKHTPETWWFDMAGLGATGLAAIVITYLLVRRLDPRR